MRAIVISAILTATSIAEANPALEVHAEPQPGYSELSADDSPSEQNLHDNHLQGTSPSHETDNLSLTEHAHFNERGWQSENPQVKVGKFDVSQADYHGNIYDADRSPDASIEDIQEMTGMVRKASIERKQTNLPGEDVNFKVKLNRSTHFHIEGKAVSELGKLAFMSQLLPSNEVKLSLKLKQGDLKDSELKGYFDLANFTMELDGANAVLNQNHKTMMDILSQHLRYRFQAQFEGYDTPEHALMLVQMLAYWSTAPAGYVYEKREIVSQ